MLTYVLIRENFFKIFFLDESRLYPSIKKTWFRRAESNRLRSNVRYEDLGMVAVITRNDLVSFQVVSKDYDSNKFLNFLQITIEKLQLKMQVSKLIIFFFDNTIVKYIPDFSKLTRLKNCVNLFNFSGLHNSTR